MAYDDAILTSGGFGPYQRRIYLLLCLSAIPCAFHTMAPVFLAAETNFRCLLPHESPENSTYQISPNLTNTFYPLDHETNNRSQCERYDVNLTDQLYPDSDGNFSSLTSSIKCDSFVYDKSTYKLTTTSEFNLVCDKSWLRPTADSLYMLGLMLGSTLFGGLSDMYGRKLVFYWCLCLQAISGLCVALSPEIISYMIFRMIIGMAGSGIFQTSYVNAVEMVVPARRTLVGMGIQLFIAFGIVLTAFFAYFIRNWRILQVALTLPSLGFFVYWWFVPESARWLITKGRLEEAKYLIQKAAVKNGIEISSTTLDDMLTEHSPSKSDLEKFSIFDLFKYPNMRRKSLILFFTCWIINATYFGLAWTTSSLVGNNYVNFVISGLVEIPSCILVFFTLDRWGRKSILCGSLVLTGVFLLPTIFIPDNISWLHVTMTMLAKLSITASTVTAYVFAAEQYPTVIRNVGVGVCATCASMGGIISPYITYLAVFWEALPYLIIGSASLFAGLMVLLLPETLNQKLPETIQDGEEFGKKSAKVDKTTNS